jgi:hypothetical protein
VFEVQFADDKQEEADQPDGQSDEINEFPASRASLSFVRFLGDSEQVLFDLHLVGL